MMAKAVLLALAENLRQQVEKPLQQRLQRAENRPFQALPTVVPRLAQPPLATAVQRRHR
jgi:hypothetical protein